MVVLYRENKDYIWKNEDRNLLMEHSNMLMRCSKFVMAKHLLMASSPSVLEYMQ